MDDQKRLFFAAQIEAPWPSDYPPARMIPEHTRHITLAFLGNTSFAKIKALFPAIPAPAFRIGPAGIGHELVFLSEGTVAALSVDWLAGQGALELYHGQLGEWLKANEYPVDKRRLYSHVTVARSPFDIKAWKEHFYPLPLFVKAVHLYETTGCLHYESLWEAPLLPPFEEFEHTADIAYLLRGVTPQQLHQHAQLALAFKHPPMVRYFTTNLQETVEEIVIALNAMVGRADAEIGCPFKAVSFHGKIENDSSGLLNWEMIVDV